MEQKMADINYLSLPSSGLNKSKDKDPIPRQDMNKFRILVIFFSVLFSFYKLRNLRLEKSTKEETSNLVVLPFGARAVPKKCER